MNSSYDNWPTFDIESIEQIQIFSDILQVFARGSEVDPAALIYTFLSAFASSVGTGPYMMVGETKHNCRINNVLVGKSSRSRKGSSEYPVRRLIELANKNSDLLPLSITSGPLSSGEGLIYAVRDANKDGNKIDNGVEDKRLLCIESEFANVLKACSREGNTLSTIIRDLWDGKDISPLTKHNIIKSTNPHICIVGHITQEELYKSLKHVEIFNVFANRFLWVCVKRRGKVPIQLIKQLKKIILMKFGMEAKNI